MPTLRASRMRNSETGFTVAEFLLVSVFVIGLFWIAVSSVGWLKDNTNTSNCQTQKRNLALAANRYAAETGKFPESKQILIQRKYTTEEDTKNWDFSTKDDGVEAFYEPSGSCG